ncbi:unnamed protein product, partial [Heterosigma akashiwo]
GHRLPAVPRGDPAGQAPAGGPGRRPVARVLHLLRRRRGRPGPGAAGAVRHAGGRREVPPAVRGGAGGGGAAGDWAGTGKRCQHCDW